MLYCFLVFYLICQHQAFTQADLEEKASKGSSGLVPFQQRLYPFGCCTSSADLLDTERAPLSRPFVPSTCTTTTPCSSNSRDGAYRLEVPVWAHQQSKGMVLSAMWRDMGEWSAALPRSPRSEPGLGRMARTIHTGGGLVAELFLEAPAESTTEKSAQHPSTTTWWPFWRQRQRKGQAWQRQWSWLTSSQRTCQRSEQRSAHYQGWEQGHHQGSSRPCPSSDSRERMARSARCADDIDSCSVYNSHPWRTTTPSLAGCTTFSCRCFTSRSPRHPQRCPGQERADDIEEDACSSLRTDEMQKEGDPDPDSTSTTTCGLEVISGGSHCQMGAIHPGIRRRRCSVGDACAGSTVRACQSKGCWEERGSVRSCGCSGRDFGCRRSWGRDGDRFASTGATRASVHDHSHHILEGQRQRIDRGRRSGQEACQNGRAHRGRASHCSHTAAAWIWRIGAFWWGRCSLTFQYDYLKPQLAPEAGVAKWMHPVVQQSDFVSEWAAAWNAFLDRGPAFYVDGHHDHDPASPSISKRRCRSRSGSVCVNFDSDVAVRFVDETGGYTADSTMSHSALSNWTDKPWSLLPEDPQDDLPWGASHTAPESFLLETPVVGLPTAGRPPLQSLPDWVQHLWHTVFVPQGEDPEYREDGPSVVMHTWYLDHQHHRRCAHSRMIEFNVLYEDWLDLLRDRWRDLVDFAYPLEVFHVQPEPPRPTGDFTQGHLLLVQHRNQEIPCLLTALQDFDHRRLWTFAQVLPPRITLEQVIPIANFEHFCQRVHCFGWVHYNLLSEEPVALRPGDGICLVAQPSEDATAEPDAFSLMARAPPSLQPQPETPPEQDFADPDSPAESSISDYTIWASVLLFNKHNRAVGARLRVDHHERLHRDAAATIGIHPDQLIALHRVHHPPQDLAASQQEVFIAQQMGDVLTGSLLRMTLVDVDFCNHWPDLDIEVRRSIRLIPKDATRKIVISALGLFPYCSQPTTGCLFWHNHELVALQHRGSLHLEHGSYLRIAVPPPPSCLRITTRAAAAALHYGSTLEDLPALSHALPEHIDINEMPNPDVELDHLPFEDGDAFNLLQTSAISAQLTDTDFAAQSQDSPLDFRAPAGLRQCHNDGELQESLNAIRAIRAMRMTHHRPTAQELDAILPNLGDLYDLWEPAAQIQNEEDGPQAAVMVWYLSHLRWRVCQWPKIAWLGSDIENWERQLTHLWRDQIDHDEFVDFVLVQPSPAHMEPTICAHLLLVQHHDAPQEIAALVSLLDNHPYYQGPERQAMILPQRVSHELLLTVSQRFHLCTLGRVARCTSWSGQLELTWEPTRGRSGQSFSVAIQRHAHPMPPAIAGYFPENPFGALPMEFYPTLPRALRDAFRELHEFLSFDVRYSPSITSWFLDHEVHSICLHSREVQLTSSPLVWPALILQHWADVIDLSYNVDFIMVHPRPQGPQWPGGTIHIIVQQRPRQGHVSALITVYDRLGANLLPAGVPRATVIPRDAGPRDILEAVQLTSWQRFRQWTHTAEVFIDEYRVYEDMQLTGYHGIGIQVMLVPQAPPAVQVADEPADEMTFLQLGSTVSVSTEVPLTLNLDSLLDFDSATCLVQLIVGDSSLTLPPFLEMPLWYNTGTVAEELSCWGHSCVAYRFGPHDKMLCLPSTWTSAQSQQHYMYAHLDVTDPHGAFLHTDSKIYTEVDHMKTLHRLGYQRAAITQILEYIPGLTLVVFQNSLGLVDTLQKPLRPPSPWPQPQAIDSNSIAIKSRLRQLGLNDTEYHLRFRRSMPEIIDFLDTTAPLSTDWATFELPPHVRSALESTPVWTPEDAIDRLLIYTDGSSSGLRHSVPDRSDDPDSPCDTWSFVVLGEKYEERDKTGSLFLLGWQAHPVMYHEDKDFYIGAGHIGSEIAEQEALFWALLWRIGSSLPYATCYRPDNLTAAHQAQGLYGAAHTTLGHRCLRGAYQLLSTLLPGDGLCVSHVRGHTNEPWNDLADFLAKQEAKRSFYFPRPALDIKLWWDDLPYLWTLFADNVGLPKLTVNGHCPIPPEVPAPYAVDCSQPAPSWTDVRYSLSLGSANVQSLYRGMEGHGGKIQYLRKQMGDLHLLFLGLQETRSEAGSSKAEDILRLASGSQGPHYGVELWVNLRQPFGFIGRQALYFDRHDFVVVHADPCLLIVHLTNHYLCAWIIVAHGPQSGRDTTDRTQWWQHFQSRIDDLMTDEPMFILIDANATAGATDAQHVGVHADAPTVNTPLWRSFLLANDLCLPSTFEGHTGPHATWTRGDGAISRRIDFVAIPCAQLHRCTHSQVLEELDTGHEFDHEAVALELQWTQGHFRSRQAHRGKFRTAWDPECLRTLPTETLTQIAVGSWQDDIGTQVDDFTHQLHTWMAAGHSQHSKACKKPYIDEDTWQLRTSKLQARRQAKHCLRQIRGQSLGAFFSAWRRIVAEVSCDDLPEALMPSPCLLCRSVKLAASLSSTCRQLRFRLKNAKRQALQVCLNDLPTGASASHILRALRPHIGSSNPKKQKRGALPIVRKMDGAICQTSQEALDRWIEHFMLMEGGVRLDEEAQHQQWRDGLSHFRAPALDLHWDQLPSLYDLEVACRGVALGKATGPDGIPSDVVHLYAPHFARLLYAQLLKLCLHGQEALLHKGGRLATAYKWKGAHDSCDSYRSLLVSSHPAKVLHKALRTHCSAQYEQYMQAQQLGGRRHVPVQLALHLTRAFVRSHRAQGRCVGILFLDLKEAFYRVVRGLVVQTETDEELLQQLSQRLGLTPDMQQQLRAELTQVTALQRTTLPEHIQRAISALHRDTHFHLHGQPDRCRTQVGTRPGDSWADIIFGFAWGRLLRDVETTLVERGILDELPIVEAWSPFQTSEVIHEGSTAFLGTTWMDDLSLCISGKDCAEVESRLGFAAGILLDRCFSFGMTPNLSKGKTEVLFSLQGPQSRAMRKRYFGGAASGTLPVLGQDRSYSLNVTGEYCHLGNLLHHSGQDGLEMQRRLGMAHQAFTTHRRAIYGNPHIAMARKIELFDSLILTKLLYGSETWTPHTMKQKERFHAGVIRLYRRLGRFPHDAHVSDDEVLVRCQALSPSELLRRQRLRYLCTLYKCSEHVTWALLHADAEWCHLVQCDFQWMYQQLWNASSLPDPEENVAPWLTIIRLHPGYWKRLVRRACAHAVQQRVSIENVRTFHDEAFQAFGAAGHLSCPPPRPQVSHGPTYFGCLSCGIRCKTLGGEGAHMFRRHRQIAAHRQFCDGTQCGSCLREYHTVGRLANHMRNSRVCREELLARGFRPLPQPGQGSTTHATQERDHNGLRVWQDAEGPKLPPVRRAEDPYYHVEFFDFLSAEILEPSSETFEAAVRAAPQTFDLSWSRFCITWKWFVSHLADDDLDLCGFTRAGLDDLTARLCDPATWPLFQDGYMTPESSNPLSLNDYEEWAHRLACAPTGLWASFVDIPRLFTKEKILLHAFSGRRRHGDLQYYVDRVAAGHPDHLIFVVSLDIIVDPTWGDVRAHGTKTFWLDGIRQGYVAAMLAGPPCNTWSIARAHDLGAEVRRRLPRVVRDAEGCLWGRLSLALRELADVQVGNDLLCFSLLAFIYLFLCERTGIIEHPALPEDEKAASIWRLPLVSLLLQQPGIELRKVWQGLFGAETTKPTHFMVLNLPSFPHQLHKWMVTKEPPRGGSIGTDETGQFKTARLKEYPPALNGGLADCFLAAFELENEHIAANGCTSVPQPFLQRCRQLVCAEYGELIGRDFAGAWCVFDRNSCMRPRRTVPKSRWKKILKKKNNITFLLFNPK